MKSKIWPLQPRKWPFDLKDLRRGSVIFFKKKIFLIQGKALDPREQDTVFPQIRPAGIIFLLGVQLRVLLERGYYSRASINFSMCKFEKIKPANIVEILHKFPRF